MPTRKSIKKGYRLANPAGVMSRYNLRLQALVKRMTSEAKEKLNKITKSNKSVMDANEDGMSSDSQLQILLNYINSKWTRIFQDKAPIYSKDMLEETNKASKSSVTSSLNKLKEGFEKENIELVSLKSNFLSEDLRKFSRVVIEENIDLIRKIPGEYVNQFKEPEVREKMVDAISKGDLNELNKIISLHSKRTERRTQLMAEDQVRKSFNGINTIRLKENGVKKFEWLHSGGGQYPREQHIEWDGEIFSFDDLPIDDGMGEPVLPGEAYNCRCTMNPVIEL